MMAYNTLDTSSPHCLLPRRIAALQDCTPNLDRGDAAVIEKAIVDMKDGYAHGYEDLDKNSHHEHHLVNLMRIQTMTSILENIMILTAYLKNFKSSRAFVNPSNAAALLVRDGIVSRTIALNELLLDKDYLIPTHWLVDSHTRQLFRKLRNECAHAYGRWVYMPGSEDHRYSATKHYHLLKRELSKLIQPCRSLLSKFIVDMHIDIAYELAHWEEFQTDLAREEEERVAAEKQRDDNRWSGQHCFCTDTGAEAKWKPCDCWPVRSGTSSRTSASSSANNGLSTSVATKIQDRQNAALAKHIARMQRS